MKTSECPCCTFTLTVAASAWVLLALFIGETGILRWMPPMATPFMTFSLVTVLVLLFYKNRAFGAFVDGLNIRVLIALHLIRFSGIYFLYLTATGDIAPAFGISSGWGGIVVAAGALILLFRAESHWVFGWSVVGLLDILFVMFKLITHASQEGSIPVAFTKLPLSLLPTLIVPLIVGSHLALIFRARRHTPSQAFSVQPPPLSADQSA